MGRRPRCLICGSKQWHKEPSSGLVVCSEGHVLQNYRNEATETDELGPHAVRKRTMKSGRKKKEKTSKANPKLYHGTRARYHYFQCLQLLLRKQVAALVKLWDLPPEFESVCRDTWTLHLSLLPVPPSPEPHYFANDGKEPDAAHKPDDGERKEDNPNSSSSSGEDEENEDEEDPSDSIPVKERAVNKENKSRRYEIPASNVAVLVVACWTLRVPVIYRDFIRIIESYDLPYLDPLRVLPTDMTLHLTKHTARSLSPYHAPAALTLHTLASRLAKLMHSSRNILTPKADVAPILQRVIDALGGTPTLYTLTKRLADILALPMTLHSSLALAIQRLRKRDLERHYYDNVPPELALIAATIIILKIVYGFDGKPRRPTDPDDPACDLPRLDEYMTVVQKLEDAEAQTPEGLFNARTTLSVGDLSDAMLDEYIDFCEKALLGSEEGEDAQRRTLSTYFPLGKGQISRKIKEVGPHRSPAMSLYEGDNALLPGQSYAIFNSRDMFGTLPEEYDQVLTRSSRWVGVSKDYLSGVVEAFERRIVRWWATEKKKSRNK